MEQWIVHIKWEGDKVTEDQLTQEFKQFGAVKVTIEDVSPGNIDMHAQISFKTQQAAQNAYEHAKSAVIEGLILVVTDLQHLIPNLEPSIKPDPVIVSDSSIKPDQNDLQQNSSINTPPIPYIYNSGRKISPPNSIGLINTKASVTKPVSVQQNNQIEYAQKAQEILTMISPSSFWMLTQQLAELIVNEEVLDAVIEQIFDKVLKDNNKFTGLYEDLCLQLSIYELKHGFPFDIKQSPEVQIPQSHSGFTTLQQQSKQLDNSPNNSMNQLIPQPTPSNSEVSGIQGEIITITEEVNQEENDSSSLKENKLDKVKDVDKEQISDKNSDRDQNITPSSSPISSISSSPSPSNNSSNVDVNQFTNSIFRKRLLARCQNFFENNQVFIISDQDRAQMSEAEYSDKEGKFRLRKKNNILFIGELINIRLFHLQVGAFCISELWKGSTLIKVDAIQLEALYYFLKAVGSLMMREAKNLLTTNIQKIQDILQRGLLKDHTRVKFLLMDVIDFYNNNNFPIYKREYAEQQPSFIPSPSEQIQIAKKQSSSSFSSQQHPISPSPYCSQSSKRSPSSHYSPSSKRYPSPHPHPIRNILPVDKYILFIGNINPDTTDERFRQIFAPFKAIKCDLKPNQGPGIAHKGWADFSNESDASQALEYFNGRTIDRYKWEVSYKPLPFSVIMKELFIEQLNPNTTQQTLKDVFHAFNPSDINIPPNQPNDQPKYGFIKFSNDADAKNAMMQLQEKEIDGSKVIINYDYGKNPKKWSNQANQQKDEKEKEERIPEMQPSSLPSSGSEQGSNSLIPPPGSEQDNQPSQ
ncbi:MAG: hypothetical protein EZS28_004787 [Streblomastix strix]|uniref:RRM domain-containing protein n=1 Tax=Streblomastix strix TaxID=222440 RepID=A0A5J4WX90_9EUKA|nr:MAG: hypothetical protein EZS28_004787 [Streblomastix strix]